MKRLILIALAAVALSACHKDPTGPTRYVGEFKVQELFDKDGCKVYRFEDGGRSVYFTDCRSSRTSNALNPVSCGKSCIRMQTVSTNYDEEVAP